MLAKKTAEKHRRYKCKLCGKEDRKGRILGHVLKYHIPMDRVPFSCSLCNFRCTDKATLVGHINQYQRHREEAAKLGVSNLSQILNRSSNPIDASTLISAVDSSYPTVDLDGLDLSIFEAQEPVEPTLPDWLEGFELPCVSTAETQVPTVPESWGSTTMSVLPKGPVKTTPLLLGSPLNFGNSLQRHSSNICVPAITCATPFSTKPRMPAMPATTSLAALETPQLGVPSMPQFQSPIEGPASVLHPQGTVACQKDLNPKASVTASLATVPARATSTPSVVPSSAATPLQDERYLVFDSPLDQSYVSDPLYLEGQTVEQRLTIGSKNNSQTVEKTAPVMPPIRCSSPPAHRDSQAGAQDRQEKLLSDILRAIESNGKELHGVNRNMRAIRDDIFGLQRAILSLERTCARAFARPSPVSAPRRRSRTPVFQPNTSRKRSSSGKDNVKSVVKKVKGDKK